MRLGRQERKAACRALSAVPSMQVFCQKNESHCDSEAGISTDGYSGSSFFYCTRHTDMGRRVGCRSEDAQDAIVIFNALLWKASSAAHPRKLEVV